MLIHAHYRTVHVNNLVLSESIGVSYHYHVRCYGQFSVGKLWSWSHPRPWSLPSDNFHLEYFGTCTFGSGNKTTVILQVHAHGSGVGGAFHHFCISYYTLQTVIKRDAIYSVSAVPTPSVHTEPPIFTESNITLHCIITLNAAVDTGTAASGVDVTWEGPQGNITSSSRIAISAVTGSSTMYESNLIIYALAMEDLGSYTCRASISPVGGSPYILMSGTGSDSETITCESVSAFLFDLHCKWRSCGDSGCTKLSIQGCVLYVRRHMLCIH